MRYLNIVCVCVPACVCVSHYDHEKKVPGDWQARQAIPAILQVSLKKKKKKKKKKVSSSKPWQRKENTTRVTVCVCVGGGGGCLRACVWALTEDRGLFSEKRHSNVDDGSVRHTSMLTKRERR